MRTAERCGVATAHVDYRFFEDEPALIVERYDRVRDASGRVVRLHQEDLCQALSVMPDSKYAEDGGPSARDVLRLLARNFAPQAQIVLGCSCYETGKGFIITADSLLNVSAWNTTQESLANARHINEVERLNGEFTLNVDLGQIGVGGTDTWSSLAKPSEAYLLKGTHFSYGFTVRPYTGKRNQ